METLTQIIHFNPYWLAGAGVALLLTTWAQWYFLTMPPRPTFDAVYVRAAAITAFLALSSQGALQAAATPPAVPPAWYVPAWSGFCAVGMWWVITRFGQKKRQVNIENNEGDE